MARPTKIGVTGATGQVGLRLLKHLRAGGLTAIAAVRNPLGAALCDAAVPGSEIRIGSLTPDEGGQHLLDDCDVIINCAIEASGGIPRQAYTRNRQLLDGLLKAKALKWLVHFSTVAVYGEVIGEYDDADRECAHPRPTSEYGRSKLDVERYAVRRTRERGVACTILRLGHVYGAGIARSREIVELARNPAFRLPFGGRLPSNAVHADTVGAAMVGLMHDGPRHEINAVAEAAHTWRDVFDWHTSCLGLPAVADMSESDSMAKRRQLVAGSPFGDAVAWAKGLPLKSLVRSPATFDLALRVLVRTPSSITRRLGDINRRTGARAQIARANEVGGMGPIASIYFSEGMPGPFVDVPSMPANGLGSETERDRELQAWYDLWRRPQMRAAMVRWA